MKMPLSEEQLKADVTALLDMTPEQFGQLAGERVTAGHLPLLVPRLADEQCLLLWNHLNNRSLLEKAAALLTPQQADVVCEAFANGNAAHQHPTRLSPLWVGLDPTVFLDLLHAASPRVLQLFKQEAALEPMQALTHRTAEVFVKHLDHFVEETKQAGIYISQIDLPKLTFKGLEEVTRSVEALRDEVSIDHQSLDLVLAVVWMSDRSDLVDLFTSLKAQYHTLSAHAVGFPQNGPEAASGLYLQLQELLERPYYEDPSSDRISYLPNETPAVEVLGRLSVWYLKDQAAVGLLPHLSETELAELSALNHSTDSERRATLHEQALSNLHRAGLRTLGDFRKQRIYSRTMLKEYLHAKL